MSAEENLRAYFRTIWKDTEGVVYLPSRGENPKDWIQSVFSWPSQEDRIVQMVQARKGEREVFVNPVIYKDNGVRDKSTLARGNALGSWVLWADFDGNANEDWPADSEIPAPTLRIRSSGPRNQHMYWALDDFLTDPTSIEDKNRALAHQLNADVSGWDFSQLLRPPDTINHGYGKDERKGRKFDVLVEESSDRSYAPSFVQRESIYRPVVESDFASLPKPSIRSVLAEGKWSKEFLNLFEKDAPSDRSSALMACGHMAAEAGCNDAAIYAVLDDADFRWGKYRDRTDRVRRLIDIVDRARKKHPYGIQDTEFGDIFGDSAIPVEDAPKIVYNFKEFMEADIEVSWQIENLLPQRGYGIIYGMPGVGKTLIGMSLANAMVHGQDWLVWKNTMGRQKVLFLSLEMNHATLKLQYSKMTASLSSTEQQVMEEYLHIAPLADTIPLDTQEGRLMMENLLILHRPNVLFIDSLSESSYKSLLDDEGVRDMNRFFRYIREKYNCSVFAIHHDRKSGATKHQDLDSMWGSRFISSATDFILFLENTDPETDQIWCIQDKNRLGIKEKPFLIDRDWSDFSFKFDGYKEDNTPEERGEGLKNAFVRGRSKRGPSLRSVNAGDDLFGDLN